MLLLALYARSTANMASSVSGQDGAILLVQDYLPCPANIIQLDLTLGL